MVRPTSHQSPDLIKFITPARDPYLIYFWRLFPFTRRRKQCFGRRSQSSHRDFSDQTQMSGGIQDRKVWILREKETPGAQCLTEAGTQHQYECLKVLRRLEKKVQSLKSSDHTAYFSLGAKGSVSKVVLHYHLSFILAQSIKWFPHLYENPQGYCEDKKW